MYRCNVCQKLYNSKTDCCDCGNDVFDEILEDMSGDNKVLSINLQQLLSGVIFVTCIGLSAWICFGTRSEYKTVPTLSTQQDSVTETTNIPSIDKLWDNTPMVSDDKTPLGFYKSELQKALYANLDESEIIDDGRCEVEFKINLEGKLTNRRIYKEKGGRQFNNLVMKMMKKTDSVDVPPEGYRDLKFRAKVYTENGIVKINIR